MRVAVISGVVILALILAQSAYADKIVLKSGESVEGALANREAVQAAPQLQTQFSLLRSDSQELLRFSAEEVDYLVLEGEGDPVVIDLASLSVETSPPQSQDGDLDKLRSSQDSAAVGAKKTNGTPLIIVGAAIAAVGALVKFGDEKLTATPDNVDYEEDSYNGLNYAMMIGGGALAVVGITIESEKARDAKKNANLSHLPGNQSPSFGPSVGLRFRF